MAEKPSTGADTIGVVIMSVNVVTSSPVDRTSPTIDSLGDMHLAAIIDQLQFRRFLGDTKIP